MWKKDQARVYSMQQEKMMMTATSNQNCNIVCQNFLPLAALWKAASFRLLGLACDSAPSAWPQYRGTGWKVTLPGTACRFCCHATSGALCSQRSRWGASEPNWLGCLDARGGIHFEALWKWWRCAPPAFLCVHISLKAIPTTSRLIVCITEIRCSQAFVCDLGSARTFSVISEWKRMHTWASIETCILGSLMGVAVPTAPLQIHYCSQSSLLEVFREIFMWEYEALHFISTYAVRYV